MTTTPKREAPRTLVIPIARIVAGMVGGLLLGLGIQDLQAGVPDALIGWGFAVGIAVVASNLTLIKKVGRGAGGARTMARLGGALALALLTAAGRARPDGMGMILHLLLSGGLTGLGLSLAAELPPPRTLRGAGLLLFGAGLGLLAALLGAPPSQSALVMASIALLVVTTGMALIAARVESR